MSVMTKEGNRGNRTPRRSNGRSWVLGAVGAVLLLLGVLLLRNYDTYRMLNFAMTPAVKVDQSVLIDTTKAGTARRGDIVLVDRSGWDGQGEDGQSLLRVVAVAGDTVSCCGGEGQLLVNGEPVTQDLTYTRQAAAAPFTFRVPAGRVFLVGDRRGVARDSTAFTAQQGGTVSVAAVQGRALGIILPRGDAKTLGDSHFLSGSPLSGVTGAVLGAVLFLIGALLLVLGICLVVRARSRRRRSSAAGSVAG